MPDLSGPRARVVEKMGSTCTIYRDAAERQDDVVDPVTLVLSSPPADSTIIYGPDAACWVFASPSDDDWGGGRTGDERPAHVLGIPWDAAVPRSGDRVTIDSCPDEAVVHTLVPGGYLLRVEDVNRSEYLVYRMFTVQRVGGPPPST